MSIVDKSRITFCLHLGRSNVTESGCIIIPTRLLSAFKTILKRLGKRDAPHDRLNFELIGHYF